MRIVLITLLVLICATATQAQSRKKKKTKSTRESAGGSPTALDPYYPQEQRQPKGKKKRSNGPTFNAERNYYERLDDLEKQKRKDAKEMSKPQYSDPMYFGHKRPPKKRPPSKMKFCKVCGIRH